MAWTMRNEEYWRRIAGSEATFEYLKDRVRESTLSPTERRIYRIMKIKALNAILGARNEE